MKRLSIFLKLLLVFIGTGLLLVLSITAVFRLGFQTQGERNPWRLNLANYAHQLARGIGDPPDLQKAERLSRELSLQIRIGEWATHPSLPELKELLERGRPMRAAEVDSPRAGEGRVRFVHYRRSGFLILEQAGAPIIFSIERGWMTANPMEWILALALLIGTVLFLSYLTIRALFSPLRGLSRGVEESPPTFASSRR